MTKDVPFIRGRSVWDRTHSTTPTNASSTIESGGKSYTLDSTRTDDGVWVGKCRELPDWTDKAATLDALEQALCDEVAGT